MTESLAVSDQQAADVAKTENRVTLESLKARVADVTYFNPPNAPQMTIAIVKLDNGYIVTGESAPADPANFNEELGQKFSYEAALRKVWPLEGYLLCEKLKQAA